MTETQQDNSKPGGFFKRLFSAPQPYQRVVNYEIPMTRNKYGNVRAHGHQPSTVDCPKCMADIGQGCGGLQRTMYHGPRYTAYSRLVLRERKAARR